MRGIHQLNFPRRKEHETPYCNSNFRLNPGHGRFGIQIRPNRADNVGVMEPARIGEQGGTPSLGASVTDQTTSNVTTLLNLAGSQNNTVQGADTPFYAPTGTSTGQISVNGTLMP